MLDDKRRNNGEIVRARPAACIESVPSAVYGESERKLTKTKQ